MSFANFLHTFTLKERLQISRHLSIKKTNVAPTRTKIRQTSPQQEQKRDKRRPNKNVEFFLAFHRKAKIKPKCFLFYPAYMIYWHGRLSWKKLGSWKMFRVMNLNGVACFGQCSSRNLSIVVKQWDRESSLYT